MIPFYVGNEDYSKIEVIWIIHTITPVTSIKLMGA